MIRLSRTTRSARDSIVPMINVAFLLLVFFLMTAVIAPPDPFEISPPRANSDDAEKMTDTLHISAGGELAMGQVRGESVFSALPQGPLRIHADARLDGALLAQVIDRMANAGVSSVELVTVPR